MEPNSRARRPFCSGACREFNASPNPGAFLAQNWTIQIPSNLSHPCLPTQSLAQSPVPSVHMHRQVVNTGCGDNDFFLVGAAALYGQRKLGWRAATLPSSTELMYIFFAVDSMCLLPASGLLSPAFAPARRAHPATGRPVLSPLSPGAARHVAAAVRSRPALSSISWPRAFERCKQRFKAKNFGACGGPRAIVEAAGWHCWRHRVAFLQSWGYIS